MRPDSYWQSQAGPITLVVLERERVCMLRPRRRRWWRRWRTSRRTTSRLPRPGASARRARNTLSRHGSGPRLTCSHHDIGSPHPGSRSAWLVPGRPSARRRLRASHAWPRATQVARHTPEHARAAADAGALPALVAAEAGAGVSEDLRAKCRKALKLAVSHLTHLPALDALAQRRAPPPTLLTALWARYPSAASCACPRSTRSRPGGPAPRQLASRTEAMLHVPAVTVYHGLRTRCDA